MLPLSKQDIKVLVVDDRQIRSCEVGCGMDWSSADTVALAALQVHASFGDRVQLKHLGLSEAVANSITSETHKEIMSGNISLPLLVINGETRISGPFDIRMLMDAVEAVIETNIMN